MLAGAAAVRLPRKIKVAMCGVQGHSGLILNAIRNLPEAEFVALSETDPAMRKSAARNAVAAKGRQYASHIELLDKEKPDVVGVCGYHTERAPVIRACAERGIHVISEKPLAITREDLSTIRAAVAKHKIQFTVQFPMRFDRQYLALRQIVQSGEIGEVAQVSAQKSYKLGPRPDWMKHRATYGGTMVYVGCHDIDLMRWITGREMVEAMAMESHVGYPEYGDMWNTTGAVFRLDNGGVANLHIDFLRPDTAATHGDDRVRVAGTKGVAEYLDARGVFVVTQKEKPRSLESLPERRDVILEFLDCVYNGKANPVPPEDCYRVTEITLAARESRDQRRAVKI
jgi:predicted dehydrogenase